MNTRISTLLTLLFVTLFSLTPILSQAHCDSMDGPVVQDAQVALENGDITPVLKWITEEQEREVRTTFSETLEIRDMNEKVRKVADRHFLETLVRLHRESEGAPYTGLKPAGTDFGPAIPAGDNALETGSLKEVRNLIVKTFEEGLHQHFDEMIEAKDYNPENIEAGREFVHKYVKFMHYVEPVYEAVKAENATPHSH